MVATLIVSSLVLWYAVGIALPFFLDGYSPGHRLSAKQLVRSCEDVTYMILVLFPVLAPIYAVAVGIEHVFTKLRPLQRVQQLGAWMGQKKTQKSLPKATAETTKNGRL